VDRLADTTSEVTQVPAVPTQAKSNFVVPDLLSRTFSGREDLLQCIGRSLHERQTGEISRTAIWGLPGIGKTQVALRYERQHRGTYQHVFFVNATSAQTIVTSYRDIARMLCSDETRAKELDKIGAERLIQAWLAKHTDWLLIYDNAIQPSVVRRYTPEQGRGHILFTTRNEITAEALVEREEAYEVFALPLPQAITFVLLLQKIVIPTNEEVNIADRLARIVRGVPIAIEQAVLLARLRKISLSEIMPDIERRKTLLEQSHPASMHEHECSTGALVVMTLDTLATDSPQAASLFRLLVYFNTSSIPIEFITNASKELEYHFSRQETYNRGLVPLATETKRMRSMGVGGRTLIESGPFGMEFWKSKTPFRSKPDSSTLPRVDSNADKAVEQFFRNNRLLQDVLEKEVRIENALLDLKKAGLIRRPSDKIIWIHDLFAQLTIAVVEGKSQSTSRDIAHLVLLMIYLSFPIPDFFSNRDICSAYVPHAASILTYCTPFYRQLTMGPELAHLTASAIDLISHSSTNPERKESLVKYYKLAVLGYRFAWDRLLSHPHITQKDVVLHASLEYDLEDSKALRHLFTLHCHGFQRFGSSAAPRAVQTLLKLGQVYEHFNDYPEALRWTAMAVKGFGGLYGHLHHETAESRAMLLSIYKALNYWVQGYALGRVMIKDHMKRYGGGLMSTTGALIASDIGDCAMGLGDTEQAARWYGFTLHALMDEYGDNARGLYIISSKLATAEGLQHDHGKSLQVARKSLKIYEDTCHTEPEWNRSNPDQIIHLEAVIALQQFELGNTAAAKSGCERALGVCKWDAKLDHVSGSYKSIWDSGLQAVWVWGCVEFDGNSKPDEWSVPTLRVTEELTMQALVKYGPLRAPCCGKQ
jgi:NB-ARC domain